MPVRKIPIQTRSKSGFFHSAKNDRLVAYESLLEKKKFLLMEFDDTVVAYEEQPLKVDKYVPDIFVQRDGSSPLLVEVKYSKETNEPDEKLRKKIDALKSFCADKGWEFELFTEKNIEEPYFENVSFLYRYIKTSVLNKREIVSFVAESGEVGLDELIKRFDAAEVYALLAAGRLKTNLHRRLSSISGIRISDA